MAIRHEAITCDGTDQLVSCLPRADPLEYVVAYHRQVVLSGGMTTQAVKRTLSMRPDVDRMLAAHLRRTPGATMSSTVNAALVEYLEAAALEAYRRWDAEADADERAALDALAADDDRSWASE